MINCQIVLPSATAKFLSVGVVMIYNGDFIGREKRGM